MNKLIKKIKTQITYSSLLVLVISSAHATLGVESTAKAQSKASIANISKGTAAAVPTVALPLENSALIINYGSKLSVELLDECWAKRENLDNQKIIVKFLQSEPEVPQNYEIAWKTARLVYFIGNFGLGEKELVNSSNGVKLFAYGYKAGEIAQKLNPAGVEGYYWYAVDLGSYGLAKGIISAAANAKKGLKALDKVQELDPSYQWHGADRIRSRYLLKLPRLLGGNKVKALDLIIEATQKSPNFRNNWVFLGQFYLENGEYQKAIDTCAKALTLPNLDGKYEEVRYIREAKECIAKAKHKLD